MNKKPFFLIGVLTLIVLIPIIVNFVITRDAFYCYRVAGEGKDWIAFYGSFLGSCISALVAYVIMFYTIKNNEKQTNKTLLHSESEHRKIEKRAELDIYRRDLSERIARINYASIIRVCQYPSDFDFNEELNRLDELYSLYQQQSNSSLLSYGCEEGIECRKFFEAYNGFLVKLCEYINETTRLICNYRCSKDFDKFEQDLLSLSKEVIQYGKEQYRIVFNLSKSLYLEKKSQYDGPKQTL